APHEVLALVVGDRLPRGAGQVVDQDTGGQALIGEELAGDLDQVAVLVRRERRLVDRALTGRDRAALGHQGGAGVRDGLGQLERPAARRGEHLHRGLPDGGVLDEVLVQACDEARRDHVLVGGGHVAEAPAAGGLVDVVEQPGQADLERLRHRLAGVPGALAGPHPLDESGVGVGLGVGLGAGVEAELLVGLLGPLLALGPLGQLVDPGVERVELGVDLLPVLFVFGLGVGAVGLHAVEDGLALLPGLGPLLDEVLEELVHYEALLPYLRPSHSYRRRSRSESSAVGVGSGSVGSSASDVTTPLSRSKAAFIPSTATDAASERGGLPCSERKATTFSASSTNASTAPTRASASAANFDGTRSSTRGGEATSSASPWATVSSASNQDSSAIRSANVSFSPSDRSA